MVSGGQSLMTFSAWPPTPSRTPRSKAARRIARGRAAIRRRASRRSVDDLDADEQAEPADLADVRRRPRGPRASRSSIRAPSDADRSASRSSRSTPMAARPGREVDGVAHERRGVRARAPSGA